MIKPVHLSIVLILIIIASSLIIRSYDIGQLRQLNRQTETQKMVALSDLSAHLIQQQWQAGPNTADTFVRALQQHPQVSNVYLTNELAGILAPKSRALEIVDDPNIEELLNNDEISRVVKVENSQLNVYRRIGLLGDEKAILVINKRLIASDVNYFSLGFILRVILLSFLGVLLSILLVKVWSKSWLKLHEDFEQALQTGQSPLTSKSKSHLVEKHALLYRRYLMKINSKR